MEMKSEPFWSSYNQCLQFSSSNKNAHFIPFWNGVLPSKCKYIVFNQLLLGGKVSANKKEHNFWITDMKDFIIAVRIFSWLYYKKYHRFYDKEHDNRLPGTLP